MLGALAVGVPALGLCLIVMWNWEKSIRLLVLVIPFAGIVAVWFNDYPIVRVLKDFVIVLPAYAGFFLFSLFGERSGMAWPRGFITLLIMLSVMVIVQSFNPAGYSLLPTLVGIKVWLFYIPLTFIAAATIRSKEDIFSLFRLLAVVSLVPVSVGLLQFLLARSVGFEFAVGLFFGENAHAVTQGFARFEFGTELYRLPSTFSFNSQYFGFLLAMIVPCYALAVAGPTPNDRLLGKITLSLIVIAAFCSGTRAAFLFLPAQFLCIVLMSGRFKEFTQIVLSLPVLFAVFAIAFDIDPLEIIDRIILLLQIHGAGVVLFGLSEAADLTVFGLGTGVNTGAARHVFAEGEFARVATAESYYMKAWIELGIIGLVLILALFVTICVCGFKIMRYTHDEGLKTTVVATLGFFLIVFLTSVKGWYIDLDPINMYFWIFLGIMMKVPFLQTPGWPHPSSARSPESPILDAVGDGNGRYR